MYTLASAPSHGSGASIYRSLIVVRLVCHFWSEPVSIIRHRERGTFRVFGLDFAETASEFNIARARLATRKCHGSVNGFAVEIIADFRLVRAINENCSTKKRYFHSLSLDFYCLDRGWLEL